MWHGFNEHPPQGLGRKISDEKLLLALSKTDIPNMHPDVILGHNAPNEAILKEMILKFRSQNMPSVQRMSMGASTLRFETIEEVTSQTAALFNKIPFVRQLVSVFFAAIFFYIIYLFAI
jgi:hypothetical protein